jgi:hypothetical protein
MSHHFCSGNLFITVVRNAWGGYSLGLCVMKFRNEVTRVMAKREAALKRDRWKERRRAELKG